MKLNADQRCEELFIDFPIPGAVHAPLCHVRSAGDLCIVGSALPISEGKITVRGAVGGPVSLDQAQRGAREALIQALAMLREELGALKKVKHCVQLTGYVVAGSDFREHGKVFDSASALLAEIFGAKGLHTRTAIGVASLPEGASVMLELVVKL